MNVHSTRTCTAARRCACASDASSWPSVGIPIKVFRISQSCIWLTFPQNLQLYLSFDLAGMSVLPAGPTGGGRDAR
jgi:hypothetical protein